MQERSFWLPATRKSGTWWRGRSPRSGQRAAPVQRFESARRRQRRPAPASIGRSRRRRRDRSARRLVAAPLQAAQAGVRIIYIASHHSLDLEREVRREGVLFYIASPVEMDMLEAKLVGILKGLLRSNPN
jgi:hypothetical protein